MLQASISSIARVFSEIWREKETHYLSQIYVWPALAERMERGGAKNQRDNERIYLFVCRIPEFEAGKGESEVKRRLKEYTLEVFLSMLVLRGGEKCGNLFPIR